VTKYNNFEIHVVDTQELVGAFIAEILRIRDKQRPNYLSLKQLIKYCSITGMA